MGGRLILIHGERGAAVDGIRDHTGRLAAELARGQERTAALPVGTTGRGVRRWGRLWRRLRRLGPGDVVVIQYSPFCWGRRGFAPGLLACVLALRAGGRRPAIALLVHETAVPMTSWRWVILGTWQRLQLAALRIAADVVFVSIEPWARHLGARRPARPVHHLPVGSNFPDAREARAAERARLGVEPEALVIACLGRDHQGWLGAYVVEAANAIAAADGTGPSGPVTLLNLGAGAPALPGLAAPVRVECPGFLDAEEFAAKLAAADLFLAPVVDGVSTRRGSVMAALQHGLAVVGTAGPLTDPVLRRAGAALCLTEVGEPGRFAAASAALAADPVGRAAMGAAGRDLYEREFDWAVTAARLRTAVGAPR